jgi:hypothetical protein
MIIHILYSKNNTPIYVDKRSRLFKASAQIAFLCAWHSAQVMSQVF